LDTLAECIGPQWCAIFNRNPSQRFIDYYNDRTSDPATPEETQSLVDGVEWLRESTWHPLLWDLAQDYGPTEFVISTGAPSRDMPKLDGEWPTGTTQLSLDNPPYVLNLLHSHTTQYDTLQRLYLKSSRLAAYLALHEQTDSYQAALADGSGLFLVEDRAEPSYSDNLFWGYVPPLAGADTLLTTWDGSGSWDAMDSWLTLVQRAVPDNLRYGPLIQARLRDQCSLVASTAIHCVASLQLAAALISVTPAIFVVPWVEDVPEPESDDFYGASGVCDQFWMVLVVARSITAPEHGAVSLREAGVIQTQVMNALKGHYLDDVEYPLRRRRSPDLGQLGAAIDYEKGIAALPMMFSAQIAHQRSIADDQN
jgi:hypothetical protein